MWLNVIVFAIIPVLPLRTHQGMELIKHSFDPLPAGLLRTVGEEVPPLQCLPLFGQLALHQRYPTNFGLVPNRQVDWSWVIKLVHPPALPPLL